MTTSTGPIDLTGKFVPSRRKQPLHWIDLTPPERVAQVTDLGLPGYRAKQISNQWYGRLDAEPSGWTDLPGPVREQVAGGVLPGRCSPCTSRPPMAA